MKKTKKIISLVLSLVLLFSITTGFSIVTFAEDNRHFTSGDFKCYLLDDGTWSISEYTGSSADIVIPSKIDGKKISTIGFRAFNCYENLKSVTISNGIEVIGYGAFQGCENLTSIIIPDSVTSIEYYAFSGCKSLTEITLPDGLIEIDGEAFRGSSNLESIIIPNSVKSIGWNAFLDCNKLKNIVVLNPNSEMDTCGLALIWGKNSDGEHDIVTLDGAKMYGYKGSTAETYANENGIKFIELTDKPIAADETDSKFTIGSENGVKIHCAYPLEDFINVSINDNVINEANYTLTEGSTILTFKPSYLNTLKAGTYTVVLNYTFGTAETELTVVEKIFENETNSKPTDKDKVKPVTDNTENAETTSSTKTNNAKSPSTGNSYSSKVIIMIAVVSGITAIVCLTSARRKCKN